MNASSILRLLSATALVGGHLVAAAAGSTPSPRSAEAPLPASSRSWELAMSRSTLLGFQLSMQKGLEAGKSSASLVDCTNRIDPAVLAPYFRTMLTRILSPDEVETTERFWRSDAGAHLAELAMAQLYAQVGATPVSETPPLSPDELAQMADPAFTATARKLANGMAQIPNGIGTDVAARLRELYAACRSPGA